jgi:hypothetical protein
MPGKDSEENTDVEKKNAAINAKQAEYDAVIERTIKAKQSLLQTLGFKRPVEKLDSIPVLDAFIEEQEIQNAEAIKNQAPANPVKELDVETTEEKDKDGKTTKVNTKMKIDLPDGATLELEPQVQKLNYFNIMHLVSPNRVPRVALVVHKEAILNMHPPTVDCPHPFMIA